jgi:hypothetical protein
MELNGWTVDYLGHEALTPKVDATGRVNDGTRHHYGLGGLDLLRPFGLVVLLAGLNRKTSRLTDSKTSEYAVIRRDLHPTPPSPAQYVACLSDEVAVGARGKCGGYCDYPGVKRRSNFCLPTMGGSKSIPYCRARHATANDERPMWF